MHRLCIDHVASIHVQLAARTSCLLCWMFPFYKDTFALCPADAVANLHCLDKRECRPVDDKHCVCWLHCVHTVMLSYLWEQVILDVRTHYFSFRSFPFYSNKFDLDRADRDVADKYFPFDLNCCSFHSSRWRSFLLAMAHHVQDSKCSMNSMNCRIHFCMRNFCSLALLYRSEFRR